MQAIRNTITAMLLAMLVFILTACSSKAAEPIIPDLTREPVIEDGQIQITLLPDDTVTIKMGYLEYDMDFDWDDGLVITNNGQTIYGFTLNRIPEIEGEEETYSAGIIEENMTTAALGIPLVEGENDFAIFVREEPSFIAFDIIYQISPLPEGALESPEGHRYASNQVLFAFHYDTLASERHRVFREYKLFIVGYTSARNSRYVGRIDDGRDPLDVVDELSLEPSVRHAGANWASTLP